MIGDLESELKIYSLGIVSTTKAKDSWEILVTPIEKIFLHNGVLDQNKIKHKASHTNASGVLESSVIEGNISLIAKWIPFGHSNRSTPPDVVKGETVLIFRYADDDSYYWTTIFNEPSIRRLEHVRYSYGDLASGLKPWDGSSSYYLEISTRDKHIVLHTSKSDGEPYGYDFILDTHNGTFTFKDDIGDSIYLDSRNNYASITTIKNIDLNTQTVNINAKTTNISGDLNVGKNLTIGNSITGAYGSGGGNMVINGNITAHGFSTF